MGELVQYARILQELEIPHGFSTAAAGDAKDPAVRIRLLAETGTSAPLATASQVHGVAVRLPGAELPVEADALLARPGRAVGVFTADCVPILLVDPGARLGAAVHAGWRGTLAGVLEAAVGKLVEAGAKASDLRAALGPRIGACCYVVGEDLARRFSARFGATVVSGSGSESRLDLGLANRWALLELGLQPDRIELLPDCTSCSTEGGGRPRFFSYRREKELSGRQLSFLALPE
jgi:YfiH family protein